MDTVKYSNTLLLQKKLDQALIGDNREKIAWEKVSYAFDQDVDFSKPIYKIKKSKLIHPDKVESILLELFRDGPNWIHANLILGSSELIVLTLVSGKSAGNPSPSINVSYEQDRTIRIIAG